MRDDESVGLHLRNKEPSREWKALNFLLQSIFLMKQFDSYLRNGWNLSAVQTNMPILPRGKSNAETQIHQGHAAPASNWAPLRPLPVPTPPSSAMKERIARVKVRKLMDLNKNSLIGKGKQSQTRHSLTTSHKQAGFQPFPWQRTTHNSSWGGQRWSKSRDSCHKIDHNI